MHENEISYLIRGCIFKVHFRLGPGLLESAYQTALIAELKGAGLKTEVEVMVPMTYERLQIKKAYRIDLLVNKKVIIEIKSVEMLQDLHHKQLITYLKLTGLKLGLLVNFNTTDINRSIFRKVNGL